MMRQGFNRNTEGQLLGKEDRMVLVPSGPFMMGTDEVYIENGHEDDGDVFAHSHPMREVYLDSFYIGKYLVTNAEYHKFVVETHYSVPFRCEWTSFGFVMDGWNPIDKTYPDGQDECPVLNVSWYDAFAYCEWAGVRLPTEAEWEKAARGIDGRRFPWGNTLIESNYRYVLSMNFETRTRNSAYSKLKPRVDSFEEGKSPYGCYQMFGSISEWCADWWDADFYKWMPNRNPVGPRKPLFEECEYPDRTRREAYKVARGSGIYPHIAYRDYEMPWWPTNGVGFRCAMDVP